LWIQLARLLLGFLTQVRPRLVNSRIHQRYMPRPLRFCHCKPVQRPFGAFWCWIRVRTDNTVPVWHSGVPGANVLMPRSENTDISLDRRSF
jgi:hypothetical protein